MADLRITNPTHFQQNLETSEYRAGTPVATGANVPGELLPAGTSVSAALQSVFQLAAGVDQLLLEELSRYFTDPELRRPARFKEALRHAAGELAKSTSPEARQAAQLLQELEADHELLADCRATLL